MKDNFLFFWHHYRRNLYYHFLPHLEICDSLPDEYKTLKEPVAVYESNLNRIIINKKYDCAAVRVHEYGHWLNWRISVFVDGIWELLWWGLSIRSLFIKKNKEVA